MGADFVKGVKGLAEIFLDIVWFWHFMDHQRKNRQQHWGNCSSRVCFFKMSQECLQETNPLQVYDLIPKKILRQTLKPLEEFWTHIVLKFLFLQIQKIFKSIVM
jgi:hypothetical protein